MHTIEKKKRNGEQDGTKGKSVFSNENERDLDRGVRFSDIIPLLFGGES